MKKVLKIMLRVYAIFSMCIVTILIIGGIVVLINFGKITAFAIGKVVDNYNTEINNFISDYFTAAIPDDSIQFESLQTIKGGGLQAAFRLDDKAMADIDINSYKDMSNEEILSELGITAADIPAEIMPLLSTVKETLVLDFKDKNGNAIFNRAISSKELSELLKTR